MHIFQKQILDQLRQTSQLRYSDLQPDDVESGHFKYHLDQLIKEGLVEQVDRGVYRLSVKGKSKVDRLSSDRVNPHLTPKVITYTLLQDEEHFYLVEKQKQPYLGLINMVGGKVHLGESTDEACIREVFEKTNIKLDSAKLLGVAQIRINHEQNLLSHAVAFVYIADIKYDTEMHKELIQIPKAKVHSFKNPAPDTLQLIDSINSSSQLFSADLDIQY